MSAADLLSAERLRQLMHYEPSTGTFTRLVSVSNKARAGSAAGATNTRTGYVEIGVDGCGYLAHRLAWLYVTGAWPSSRLSFRDGVRSNVRWANLQYEERHPALGSLSPEAACARVRSLVDYDPATGLFTSKTDRLEWRAGQPVGSVIQGYVRIGIDGEQHMAHRLAWLHHHGWWPLHNVDHRDGNGTHNWIDNLRDVPQSVNAQNQRAPRRDNHVGLLGVHLRKDTGKFSARIGLDGKTHSLGCFNTAEQAHAAYVSAKRVLHEGNTL